MQDCIFKLVVTLQQMIFRGFFNLIGLQLLQNGQQSN